MIRHRVSPNASRPTTPGAALTLALAMTLALSGCAPETLELSNVFSETPRDTTGTLGENTEEMPGDTYFKLAIEYLKRGDYISALQRAKRGLEISPNSPLGNNTIALIYEQVGEFGPAEHHFKKAVDYSPRDPYIRNAYGAFLCKQGRYAEADREFDAALSNPLYPTPEVALTNAGVCAFKQGDYNRAEERLRQALQRNRQVPAALYHMTEIFVRKGDFVRAKGYLDRYHAVQRPTARSLALGVRIANGIGDKNAAASYEMMLRSNFPDSEDILLLDRPPQPMPQPMPQPVSQPIPQPPPQPVPPPQSAPQPAPKSPYSIERSIAR
jgi:type IV pilus assembly protein PilF